MKPWSLLLVPVLSLGCSPEVPLSERVVAEIAGQPITVGEFERFVARAVQEEEPFLPTDVMEALFEQFIEEQLLLRAAVDAEIAVEPAVLSRRAAVLSERDAYGEHSSPASDAEVHDTLESQIRIERLVETVVLGGIAVSDDEVASHYESNRAYFERPGTVDFAQIVVEDEALAREVLAELRAAPERFDELAETHSVGPEASRGGRLGRFGRGELPPSIEQEVFELRPGRISDVVATDFGYHIFRLDEKTDQAPLSLDDVGDTIRVELLREKSDAALAEYVARLKEDYPVTVHREHLSFALLDWEDEELP